MNRFEYLDGYEFSGCAVRRRSIIAFFGTKWEDKDALETRTTGVFLYYPEKPPERRWGYNLVGETAGISGSPAFKPEERWVFVMRDGEVFVVGGGAAGWERRINPGNIGYFPRAKVVADGYAYAVGIDRTVYRREAKDQWVRLENGMPANLDPSDGGFKDVDGFGDSELYACGGKGDLWRFDGRTWSHVELPTNAALRRIACGADGRVCILTDQRTVVAGRGDSWKVIDQKETQSHLEELVWFEDRMYVSTENTLFEVVDDAFKPTRLDLPEQSSYAHLAARDGILVVAGNNDACMYDGQQWTTILEPA